MTRRSSASGRGSRSGVAQAVPDAPGWRRPVRARSASLDAGSSTMRTNLRRRMSTRSPWREPHVDGRGTFRRRPGPRSARERPVTSSIRYFFAASTARARSIVPSRPSASSTATTDGLGVDVEARDARPGGCRRSRTRRCRAWCSRPEPTGGSGPGTARIQSDTATNGPSASLSSADVTYGTCGSSARIAQRLAVALDTVAAQLAPRGHRPDVGGHAPLLCEHLLCAQTPRA